MFDVKDHVITCECISPTHTVIFKDISIQKGKSKEKELLIFTQMNVPKGIFKRVVLSFKILFNLNVVSEYPWADTYMREEKIKELRKFLDEIG